MLPYGLGVATHFFKLDPALEMHGGTVIEFVNPSEEGIIQRRFHCCIGRVVCELLLRFSPFPKPPEHPCQGEMSGAVPRKEITGFGITAGGALVIPQGPLHPS